MQTLEIHKQQIEKIVHAFAEALLQQLGNQIHEVIWYGSTARGDAEEGSDIDVAVICQSDDRDTEEHIWDIASELDLEYNAVIDVRVISADRFYGEWGRLSYLAEDIRNEGISIWKRNGKSMATS